MDAARAVGPWKLSAPWALVVRDPRAIKPWVLVSAGQALCCGTWGHWGLWQRAVGEHELGVGAGCREAVVVVSLQISASPSAGAQDVRVLGEVLMLCSSVS